MESKLSMTLLCQVQPPSRPCGLSQDASRLQQRIEVYDGSSIGECQLARLGIHYEYHVQRTKDRPYGDGVPKGVFPGTQDRGCGCGSAKDILRVIHPPTALLIRLAICVVHAKTLAVEHCAIRRSHLHKAVKPEPSSASSSVTLAFVRMPRALHFSPIIRATRERRVAGSFPLWLRTRGCD